MVPETPPRPDRGGSALPIDPPNPESSHSEAAAYWVDLNSARWAQALEAESRHGIAVCDTDPLKLHYTWSLWRIGELPLEAWEIEAAMTRQAFMTGRIGLSDLVVVSDLAPDELSRRRSADPTRQRRKFDLHLRLADPLRAWYEAINRLDPGRVVFRLPANGLDQLNLPAPRTNRSDVELFDQLLADLRLS